MKTSLQHFPSLFFSNKNCYCCSVNIMLFAEVGHLTKEPDNIKENWVIKYLMDFNSALFRFCIPFLIIVRVCGDRVSFKQPVLFSIRGLAHNMKGKKGSRCPGPSKNREIWPLREPLLHLLLFLDCHVPWIHKYDVNAMENFFWHP